MAINRKSFSSILPVAKQMGYAKVLSVSLTPAGYTRISTVRTALVDGKPVDHFTSVMIHPDRALGLDVAQFDAVSFSGIQPRQSPGEAQANTEYLWAKSVTAIGRHLVEPVLDEKGDEVIVEGKRQMAYAGLGIYGTPAPTEESK